MAMKITPHSGFQLVIFTYWRVFLLQLIIMFITIGYFYNANRGVSKFIAILWSVVSFILWIVGSFVFAGDYELLFGVFLQIGLVSINYYYLHKIENSRLLVRIQKIFYDDFSKNFVFNYSLSKQTSKDLSIRIFDSKDNFLYDIMIDNRFEGNYEVSCSAENFGSANYYTTIGPAGSTKIMDKRNFSYIKNSRVSLF